MADLTPDPPVPRADPAATARQRLLIAASSAAKTSGSLESVATIESTLGPEAALPPADDILHRVDAVMNKLPADETGDPDEFRRALEIVYRHAGTGLAKLAADPAATLSAHEGAAMEAVIKADGSRPSLLIKDGKLRLDHPMLGNWADRVAVFAPEIEARARAVGRIQPTGGNAARYAGTGWLIDKAKGLVLTNYHVLEDARRTHGVGMVANGSSLDIPLGLEIDFSGESGSLATNRFRVVAAEVPQGFGSGIGFVDAAVLRIEPMADSLWPEAIRLSADPDYASGAIDNTLATIGFPGAPERSSGVVDGIDWAWVTFTLFGKRFGVKRFAPGVFWDRLGTNPLDRDAIAFGHDATTLGGASGSPVLAWTDPGAPAFGLHFAGTTTATRPTNYAVAVAAAADALRAVGVPC